MDIILKYFPELSSDKIEKFKQLEALYIYWNQKINVVVSMWSYKTHKLQID